MPPGLSSSVPLALVVDDDPRFRLLVRHVLATAGVRTSEAGPQDDVVGLARRDRPDVVLLDWRMPGPGGIEICRRLRADPAVGDVPVVIVTGLSHPLDRAAALEAGAAEMLTKGSMAELTRVVLETVSAGRPAG